MTALRRGLLVATLLAAALLAAGARPAAAATPCWKTLLADWYDGRIDHVYPLHCYRDALHHLPADVQEYSSAHSDIERALLAVETRRRGGGGGGSGTAGLASAPDGRGGAVGSGAVEAASAALPGNRLRPGIASFVDRLDPAGPEGVPVPLLVLGGLGLLLVAGGGAGVLVRRRQPPS